MEVEMKFTPNIPYRKFEVGKKSIVISDCGHLELESDEQITIIRKSGAEYDFAAKEWGFYATASINRRLATFGFKTAVVRNLDTSSLFILIVETGYEEKFYQYLASENMKVEQWLG
jgi:hypothetical protein